MWFRYLFTSLVAVAALPVAQSSELKQLTGDDFSQETATGTWFVEYFSPWCGHCTAFAPTWKELVQAKAGIPGLTLAQVNCVTQGDLCSKNGIGSYPTMKLYQEGKYIEDFKGARDLEKLVAFIDERFTPATSSSSVAPTSNLNPNGQVLTLDKDTLQQTIDAGPVFVKYFAPWCGHCKKLAPTWVQFAEQMRGLINVAEVNCDDHSSLCKSKGVEGFPTLHFYHKGQMVDYTGGRNVAAMELFVKRAIAPSVQLVKANELDALVKSESVLYLLLYPDGEEAIVKTVEEAAKPLLGHPPVVKSKDPNLFRQFKQDMINGAVLLTIKDHTLNHIAHTFSLHPSPSVGQITDYLQRHQFPTLSELTIENFLNVMKSPSEPFVVLAAMEPSTKSDSQRDDLFAIARAWREEGLSDGRHRDVLFVWMNAERWTTWLKKQYSITQEQLPAVIIVDHANLVYYNVDTDGEPLRFDKRQIFRALAAVYGGELVAKNSENLFERIGRRINNRLEGLQHFVMHHPIQAVVFLVGFVVLLYWVLRRFVDSDLPSDYVAPKHHSRLD